MKPAARHMRQSVSRSDLLKRRLDAFTRPLNGIEKGDIRALHRVRVASRRLRELLPVLQLERAAGRKLSRRLRKVTGRLGLVRELDVLLLSIDELHVSRRARGGALGRVGVSVSKDRDRARRRLSRQLGVADLRHLARKIERLVSALRTADAESSREAAAKWRAAIDARVARRAGYLGEAIRDAGAVYLPERLHAVRVALKKARYALELAQEASGQRLDADAKMLKRGQDLLGRMHDLQVLTDRVRQVQARLAPPTLSEWRDLDALIVSLEDDCRRLHARYMRLRVSLMAIADRFGRDDGAADRTATRRAG
jgi:CHAD domain-containing protein